MAQLTEIIRNRDVSILARWSLTELPLSLMCTQIVQVLLSYNPYDDTTMTHLEPYQRSRSLRHFRLERPWDSPIVCATSFIL